jgi:hypothetical protein
MKSTKFLAILFIILLPLLSCAGNNDSDAFQITYDGNGNTGGAVPVDDQVYDNEDSVKILGNTGRLQKTGFCYNGWNTAQDGSGTHYVGGGTSHLISNTVLYAEWKTFASLVDFDTASGTIMSYRGIADDLVIPESIDGVSVTYIDLNIFAYRGLDSVSLPTTLLGMRLGAFSNNDLTTLTIPENVTSIGMYAFADNSLTSVSFSTDLLQIWDEAFAGNDLTSLDLSVSPSLSNIYTGSFDGSPLTSIKIGAAVTISDTATDEGDGHALYAMGTHGDSFRTLYIGNGRQAGTYTYSGGVWTKQP